MKSLTEFIIEQQTKDNSSENIKSLANNIKLLGDLVYKNKNHGKVSWGRELAEDEKLYNTAKNLIDKIKSDIENKEIQKYNFTKTNYTKCFPKRRKSTEEYYICFNENKYEDFLIYSIWIVSSDKSKGKNICIDFNENDNKTIKINSLKRVNLFGFKTEDSTEMLDSFIIPIDKDVFSELYGNIKEIEETR